MTEDELEYSLRAILMAGEKMPPRQDPARCHIRGNPPEDEENPEHTAAQRSIPATSSNRWLRDKILIRSRNAATGRKQTYQ